LIANGTQNAMQIGNHQAKLQDLFNMKNLSTHLESPHPENLEKLLESTLQLLPEISNLKASAKDDETLEVFYTNFIKMISTEAKLSKKELKERIFSPTEGLTSLIFAQHLVRIKDCQTKILEQTPSDKREKLLDMSQILESYCIQGNSMMPKQSS
jgi:hypothetical protein